MKKLTAPSPTPTSQQERIEVLEKQNEELKALVAWYEEQFRLKQHQTFGSSSEKTPTGQMELPLFNEAEITAPTVEPPTEDEEPPTKEKSVRKKRATQMADLPVETVIYTLPEDEQDCSTCGHQMNVMKTEIRRELKIIPAEVKVIEHERKVYVCRTCEEHDVKTPIVPAPMPQPVILKSMASPSAVAHIMTQKYMTGLPLYRQEQQLKQQGVDLTRQTLSHWVLSAGDEWLSPMVQEMKATLLNQEVLHADETTLQVLHEPGRSPTSSSYMWVYRTGRDGLNCVIYDYQTTRASKHPKRFLDGFKGFIHVDGYKGYDGLPKVTLSGCWAHLRRKFDQAQKAAPPKQGGSLTLAEQALQKIGAIYRIEKKISSMTAEDRLKIRQKESLPLVEAYFSWVKSVRPTVLPKSKLGEALQYSLNQQKKLMVPFSDGRLDLDNNRAERSIKPFVIGRKNWLFSNSSKGAKVSANIYSVIETAKENGLNVFQYLVYLFETLPNIDIADPKALKQHLPWSTELPAQCYLSKTK